MELYKWSSADVLKTHRQIESISDFEEEPMSQILKAIHRGEFDVVTIQKQ